ncbi:MAG: membrane protein insertion efficiency factor YidD [Deltaproteobacteria bacterium]|nr:membrane protein insertion efficiency factor YidD [Deltaproteobacteria bacterium]
MLSKFIIFFIRIYRLLFSPILPRSCRFYPSCSRYAEEAIVKHGPITGIVLTTKRLLRCHPWTPGGYDPVP